MILLRILGYAWSLPLSLVGLLVAVLVDRARSWRWQDGALTAIAGRRRDGTTRILGRPGAQTIGAVQVYSSAAARDDSRLRRHEGVHVTQAMILGLLFPLLYGGHWLALLVVCPAEPAGWPRWKRAYAAIWAERMARRAAGI